MGLFSFFRKNKQASTATEGEFYSRAEEASNATRARSKRGAAAKGGSGKQGGEPVDPVLPEKKRARRRLVGAIALVLAVIIVLPMILDSVPKPISGDIDIQIPSKDKPFQGRQLLPAANAAASASALDAVPSNAADSTTAGTDNVSPVSDAPAAKTTKDVPPAATSLPNNDKSLKSVAKDPVVDQKVEKPAAALVAADKAAEAARANAILDGKTGAPSDAKAPETKPVAEKKSTKFVVQVAALASAEKVSELQTKLRDAGIKSFTQKIATQSGERIRVRIGPFASKAEAEQARAKLLKMGLNGSLAPA